jgi:DNA-binding PadR family transcriptional regulator
MILSNTETALLVLLSEGPAHPYQLDKKIADRSMDEWSELSRSTIYKTLARLEAKGLARSEGALTERNVGRRTYSLTEDGKRSLVESLTEFLSKPERSVWRIDLATSHLDLLEPAAVEAAFNSYARELESLVACYGRLEEYLASNACPPWAMALARRPQALYRAELAWLAEYRSALTGSRATTTTNRIDHGSER